MTRTDYLRPPEDIDMAAEERAIRRGVVIAFAVTVVAFFAGYRLLPELPD